jgi:hypothetical protein
MGRHGLGRSSSAFGITLPGRTQMDAEAKQPIRCAIYTRKSSEEVLEQSFNSLDAQREACRGFIASHQPAEMALEDFRTRVPIDWATQRQVIGFHVRSNADLRGIGSIDGLGVIRPLERSALRRRAIPNRCAIISRHFLLSVA